MTAQGKRSKQAFKIKENSQSGEQTKKESIERQTEKGGGGGGQREGGERERERAKTWLEKCKLVKEAL